MLLDDAATQEEGDASLPEPEAEPEPARARLLMIGDLLMHEGVIYSGEREDGSFNYDHLFTHIADDVRAADVAVLNQETILGGTAFPYSGYPQFNSPQELGDADNMTKIAIGLSVNGEQRSSVVIDNLQEEVGRVIEGVSRFFTIRQGDILLYGKPADKALVEVNDHITGLLNGQVLTEFNIK